MLQLESAMRLADFESESRIQSVYMRELEMYFIKFFNAKAIRALDFQACLLSTYLNYVSVCLLIKQSFDVATQAFHISGKPRSSSHNRV